LTPLERTLQSVEAHWSHLQGALRALPLPQAAHITINPNWTTDLVVAALTGPSAEFVNRERGGRVSAYPLLLTDNSGYWFSWRERWDYVAGSRRPWRFRESGVTVFEGKIGSPEKVQLFRVEWPGITSWRPGTLGWQAPGAGHPHWQFDALAELEERFRRERTLAELEELLSSSAETQDFGQQALREAASRPFVQTWTRMHFPSQAQWGEFGWDGDIEQVGVHAHAPTNEKQIRQWLTAAILYLRNELAR